MNNVDINEKPKHMTSIGGQALIEGLMMIGPENAAIAIRKPDGEIIIDKRPLPKKSRFSKMPVVRGAVGLIKQMVMGIKALMYSAEFVDLEEEEDKEDEQYKKEKKTSKIGKFFENISVKIDDFINKILGDKAQEVLIYVSLVISLAFSVGLFIVLPNFLAGFLPFDKNNQTSVVLLNLFEGIIKVSLFLGYMALVSNLKDIKRVWQYHGAEHKTIHCYENREELTVENIKKYTTRHPRCGTSFMFTVIAISIIIFSFTGWHKSITNTIIRLALMPLVAGISYEIIRFAGKSNWKIMKVVNAPGLMFQGFTTREPDDKQIEVAIEAMKNVLVEDKEADKW